MGSATRFLIAVADPGDDGTRAHLRYESEPMMVWHTTDTARDDWEKRGTVGGGFGE